MFTLVGNGIIIDPYHNKVIENGGILLNEKGVILDIGTNDEMRKKAFQLTEKDKVLHLKVIDIKNKVLLPGMICAHHHFYSSFARGLVLKGYQPKNFVEILQQLWWKLDKLLSPEEIYYSSIVGLIDCLRSGVTTIIDHHESQGYQIGSLSQIKKAVEFVGLRASLCLGISDRYGKADEGIEENETFIKEVINSNSEQVSAMIGLHASFTVSDETLKKVAMIKEKYNVGIHTHCAEDLADEEHCLKTYNCRVVERFYNFGLLDEKTILAHCVHIDDKEIKLISETKSNIVVNPESNMNNAVGCADILKFLSSEINVGLGTDAMSSNMLSTARSLYLIQRHYHKNPNVAFVEAVNTLFKNNVKIVELLFGKKFNTLTPGVPLDAVVYSYIPPTPITENNFYGHLLFGILYSSIDSVFVSGKQLMQEGHILNFSERHIIQETRKVAEKFQEKFI